MVGVISFRIMREGANKKCSLCAGKGVPAAIQSPHATAWASCYNARAVSWSSVFAVHAEYAN